MELKLALTGFGNVGQGVAQLLRDHGDEYRDRYGITMIVTGVADRGGAVVAPNGLSPARLLDIKRSHGTVAAHGGEPGLHGNEFLERARADILLEAASTSFEDAEPGWSYARGALARGMDVVLASKGALVLHYSELMKEAKMLGRQVMYAGTVGAPLPVLELFDRGLIGAGTTGFEGILNGTTNTILTAMEDGATYDDGVRMAQESGIAETDPTLDVDGWDAAAKTVIVANTVLGASLQLDDVGRQGIREVTLEDLQLARAEGNTIKLIARASRVNGEIRASVAPEIRSQSDDLGRLRHGDMGIIFHTQVIGTLAACVHMEGSGGVATALTMLRDVVNLARSHR